jgi:hypothetical protein
VFFDIFEAVTNSTILYNFGCSFNSARNIVTMLTLITVKNVLADSHLLVLFKEAE